MADARHALTILAVPDLARTVAFYDAAFGWPAPVRVPVYVEYALPGGQRLGVYERNGFGRNTGAVPAEVPAGALAPVELYLYAGDPEAQLARAIDAGGRPLSPLAPRDWGDDVGYVADPDGVVLAIARLRG